VRRWLSLAGLVVAAACLLLLGGTLAPWQLALLWGAWLVALALLWRRARPRLFGPVFRYDLVRSARQGRPWSLRALYAGLLLVVLFLLYSSPFAQPAGWAFLFEVARVPPKEVSAVANRFFAAFLCVQLGVVLLVTPAYAAGAIAEDRERRTLDFLLV